MTPYYSKHCNERLLTHVMNSGRQISDSLSNTRNTEKYFRSQGIPKTFRRARLCGSLPLANGSSPLVWSTLSQNHHNHLLHGCYFLDVIGMASGVPQFQIQAGVLQSIFAWSDMKAT